MSILYTAVVDATAGREGKVVSDDGNIDLKLTPPKSLGGPGGPGTNPEQLFAAGYAACFGSALKLVAGQRKVVTGPVTITAKVSLAKTEAGYHLAVELEGKLSDLPADQARELMEAAHQVCPYSKATRGNIEVKLSVA